MTSAIRVIVAIAFALTSLSTITAQARTAPPNPAKAIPKVSSVTQSNNAAALAAQLVGPGVTISNAKLTGAAEAAGTFAGGQASVGIDTGVVLSTGQAVNVRGPNESDSWSDINGTPGDARLDALVDPEITYDAAILEFDVTPSANTIAIRFVFASDEYPEFVGTSFNDVIAIFVNGVNCANYNGRPVSVNSINAGVNANLFIDNDTGTRNTEMDGLTVPLDCVASVTPNASNHVTIVIADTADQIYDSAVFLAAGGIRSPGSGPVTTSNVDQGHRVLPPRVQPLLRDGDRQRDHAARQRHVRRLGTHRQGVQRVPAGNSRNTRRISASSAAPWSARSSAPTSIRRAPPKPRA